MGVRGLVAGISTNTPEVIPFTLLEQRLKSRPVLVIGAAVHSFRKRQRLEHKVSLQAGFTMVCTVARGANVHADRVARAACCGQSLRRPSANARPEMQPNQHLHASRTSVAPIAV